MAESLCAFISSPGILCRIQTIRVIVFRSETQVSSSLVGEEKLLDAMWDLTLVELYHKCLLSISDLLRRASRLITPQSTKRIVLSIETVQT